MIIELENITELPNKEKMTVLMSKIKSLGQEYTGSPHCFPIGNILYRKMIEINLILTYSHVYVCIF